MDEPPWKKIKLSLERPYKDDNGDRIPVLLDITPEGEHIYEPQEIPSQVLGENLRRIFVERGIDFFDKNHGALLEQGILRTDTIEDVVSDPDATPTEGPEDTSSAIMTTEELFKMRMEILPQLFIALGEMTHAKELLALLLASDSDPTPALPPLSSVPAAHPSTLSATIVSKPPPIISVQAFNSQLAIGGKDEALRKAADVFKTASESMERGRIKGEKYWVNALKIRRANWGLIPAPLPFGSATGKGDKTSKDFLISYGLEESPPMFRRRAVGHMATNEATSDALVFPHRQHTRLRVALSATTDNGGRVSAHNRLQPPDDDPLSGSLKAAQQEVVEQEIFSLLVREASSLPTASARVSERLIVVDAAQGLELKFELVDNDSSSSSSSSSSSDIQETALSAKCDLIYHALHALLLRIHSHTKLSRLGKAGVFLLPGVAGPCPPLLQPVIDLLQYQVFCDRVKKEVDKVVRALTSAGVPTKLRFEPIGEIGNELIQLFETNDQRKLGGEVVLRINNRHTLRLTFVSPSSLTAHLSQATLSISSIPQLYQLLFDEIERCLLTRICEIGTDLCEQVGATWFMDLSRCIGRWEGCVLNFNIYYGMDGTIDCSAFRLEHETATEKSLETYSSQTDISLLSWVERTIERALLEP